jgi:hypothetical protein
MGRLICLSLTGKTGLGTHAKKADTSGLNIGSHRNKLLGS